MVVVSVCGCGAGWCPGIRPPGQAPDLLGLVEELGRGHAVAASTGDRTELVFPGFAGGVEGGLGRVCVVSGGP